MTVVYPWSAVVGQDALKLALLLCAIDRAIGGVLVQGPRGVAKTTLARALGELVQGNFVELPLGASEERVVGTLDLERALRDAAVEFSPGLLARAHDGVLYVDEINLLPDLIVDLLLDAAASGVNRVERDGLSHAHPARFVLIGTMNPEEGELRPQLTDRFGLSVSASNQLAPPVRAAIISRRLEFDADPSAFIQRHAAEQAALIARCVRARQLATTIPLNGPALIRVTELCHAAGVEGVRADLAMLRAARAHAAWHERDEISAADVDAVAELALAHRRGAAPDPSGPGQRGGGGAAAGSPAAEGGGSTAPGGYASNAGSERGPERDAQAPRRAGPHAAPWQSFAAARGPGGTQFDAPARSRQREGRARGDADSCTAGADDADTSSRAGRLLSVPIAPNRMPALPAWIAPARIGEVERRRRGRPRLAGGATARPRTRSVDGPIDWFATLLDAAGRAVAAAAERRGSESELAGFADFASGGTTRGRRYLELDQLRRRARHAPPKQLWILALDCSASMLRGGALAAAKSVALALASGARRAGAHVALISFHGNAARRTVDAHASHLRFSRSLAAQGGGGGTPLRSAVREAHALCDAQAFRSSKVRKQLVILSDARTRESVEDLAPRKALATLVIDCERAGVRLNRAAGLASALGARYLHLDSLAR